MNVRTALVAHPFPIVVDALAALVAAAGYTVVRASDRAATAAALATTPDLVVIAATLDGGAGDPATAHPGAARLVVGDAAADGVVALSEPVARLAAAIAALAGTAGTAALAGTAAPDAGLTPRERDVARLVAAGQRNRRIAETLGISEGTVKMHLHNVYTKLGLESRTQLAMAAERLGAR